MLLGRPASGGSERRRASAAKAATPIERHMRVAQRPHAFFLRHFVDDFACIDLHGMIRTGTFLDVTNHGTNHHGTGRFQSPVPPAGWSHFRCRPSTGAVKYRRNHHRQTTQDNKYVTGDHVRIVFIWYERQILAIEHNLAACSCEERLY